MVARRKRGVLRATFVRCQARVPLQNARVHFQSKILSSDALIPWRQSMRESGRVLVVTNGVFDILHVGHATYLEAARALGGALLVGITCDAGVRELKGPDRPLNNERD